jgi:cell division protein FtsW (lipid II flippase)
MSTTPDFSEFYQQNKALLKEYLDARTDLLKLQGIKILSQTFSLMLVIMLAGMLGMFVVLFLGFAFAWWIAELTGSNIIGFSAAAGLFGILLLIVLAIRKSVFQKKLIQTFIQESLKDRDDSIL